jgi:hypothetical protein
MFRTTTEPFLLLPVHLLLFPYAKEVDIRGDVRTLDISIAIGSRVPQWFTILVLGPALVK